MKIHPVKCCSAAISPLAKLFNRVREKELKKNILLSFVILLFLAGCWLKKDISLEPQIIAQDEKIEELEKEIKYLKKNYQFQVEQVAQELEKIKEFILLLEARQGDISKASLRPFIPEEMEFCGEKVPLERFRVKERLESALSYELARSGISLVFLRSGRWFPLIENKIQEKNLPQDLKYVAAAESYLNPEAYSFAGAAGLWQFIRDTGRKCKLSINTYVDERFESEKSTEAALEHLRVLYLEFKNWPSAFAGYNMHKDRYKKALLKERSRDFYDVKDIPKESLEYVFRIIALKLIMEYPEKYGFPSINEINKLKYQPYPVEAKEVIVSGKAERIVEIASRLGMNYHEFRIFNPHIKVGKNSYGEVARDYLPKGKYKIYVLKKN